MTTTFRHHPSHPMPMGNGSGGNSVLFATGMANYLPVPYLANYQAFSTFFKKQTQDGVGSSFQDLA